MLFLLPLEYFGKLFFGGRFVLYEISLRLKSGEHFVLRIIDVALKVNEKGTCYGMESEIKIIDYDKQTSGTVYVVNFGDGRDTTLTQAEMMKTMGSVKHTFQTDNCPITVELEARNECSDYMLPLQTTVTTAVVIPPEAAFDFVAPGCTGYPVQVINRTIEGRDVYCNTIAEYIWKFGDKPSVFEKYPQVIFDTPGEYEVRLIASTGGWNVPTIQS